MSCGAIWLFARAGCRTTAQHASRGTKAEGHRIGCFLRQCAVTLHCKWALQQPSERPSNGNFGRKPFFYFFVSFLVCFFVCTP